MNNMELFFEDHKLQFLTKLENTKKKFLKLYDEKTIKMEKLCMLGCRTTHFRQRMLPHK